MLSLLAMGQHLDRVSGRNTYLHNYFGAWYPVLKIHQWPDYWQGAVTSWSLVTTVSLPVNQLGLHCLLEMQPAACSGHTNT